MTDSTSKNTSPHQTKAKEHLGAGIGLGVVSICTAAAGAVCPLCIVAVPALIGSGLYHRRKHKKSAEAQDQEMLLETP